MKTITLEKAIDVNILCQVIANGELTKTSYGCKRVVDQLLPLIKKEYDTPVYEKRISLAVVGEKGEILVDEKGNPKLTPTGLIELDRYSKELMKKELQVELYQIQDITAIHGNIFAMDMLNGFVIDVDIESMIK